MSTENLYYFQINTGDYHDTKKDGYVVAESAETACAKIESWCSFNDHSSAEILSVKRITSSEDTSCLLIT